MGVLEIKNLHVTIGNTPILQDINISLNQGDSLGLVGESGAGKTMISLATMGLLPPHSQVQGAIRFDGQNVLNLSEKQLCGVRGRHISMVFQEPMSALNPLKTIGDQIAEGILFHQRVTKAVAYERTRDVLDKVGLSPSVIAPNRFPHELSGGQRQRVVIAIALALNPKLIIADEPTTALDVTTQDKILNLLRDVTTAHNTALMLITHDLAVVAQMVNRIAVMRCGKIVETDNTLSLFKNCQHPYTQQLYDASMIKPKHTPPRIAPHTPPLLQVKNIKRYYPLPRTKLWKKAGVYKAVDDVSFCIQQGESVGLVGESGCGKSTLARTLLALNAPTSGTVQVLGKNLFDMPRKDLLIVRRHMQVVFQDPYGSFNPRHKVGRLIAEPLHLISHINTQTRNQRIMQSLCDVGLSADDADKYPHEFSGGQRQRIAIARALITQPKFIIADEAVSALDVSIRQQILEVFHSLAEKRGLSYLFISHDLHVVRAITDRVLVMKQGKIVEHGTTATVFDNPQHPYTRALLASTPDLQHTLTHLEHKKEQG